MEEEIKEVAKAFLNKKLNQTRLSTDEDFGIIQRHVPLRFESNTHPEKIGKPNIDFTTTKIYEAWMNRRICINSKQIPGMVVIGGEAEKNSFLEKLQNMEPPEIYNHENHENHENYQNKPKPRIFFTSNKSERLDDVLGELYDNLKNFWDKKGDLGDGHNFSANLNSHRMKSSSMWEGAENKKRRIVFGMDKIKKFLKLYAPTVDWGKRGVNDLYKIYTEVHTKIKVTSLFTEENLNAIRVVPNSDAVSSHIANLPPTFENIKVQELINVWDLIIWLKDMYPLTTETFFNYLYGLKSDSEIELEMLTDQQSNSTQLQEKAYPDTGQRQTMRRKATELKTQLMRKFYKAQEEAYKGNKEAQLEAQLELGNMYFNGIGVSENKADAVKYYKMAADKGNKQAQLQIGNMYFDGIGVLENKADAVKYYKMAAEQGSKEAQKRLGYMYGKGIGVTKNSAESNKYDSMELDESSL